jgi:phosphoglycerate dehydrogenase-like enzyme
LISFPNVIITGHQAFFTKEAQENIVSTTLQNISDFQTGKETNELTKTVQAPAPVTTTPSDSKQETK